MGDGSSSQIRLVYSCELKPPVCYTALSHCWGRLHIKTLLESNMSELQQGVELRELPRTFQDAVGIVRTLGMRYLWIDSLCIVQDSKDDWVREAARMGDVYRQAELTIAAAAGEDGNAGLFSPRERDWEACLFESRATGESGWVGIVPSDWDREWEKASGSHLQTRAWTFQERVLSTRVLHFGKGGLFWECRSSCATEICQRGLPHANLYSGVDWTAPNLRPVKPAVLTPKERRWDTNPRAAVTRWFELVEEYSSRDLTVATDKLIALSGIAKRIRQLEYAELEYVAGNWGGKWFGLCLSWASLRSYDSTACERPASRLAGPSPYVAPSWSWVSFNGPVVYPFERMVRGIERVIGSALVSVVGKTIGYATGDDAGQVTGGHVILKGNAKAAIVGAVAASRQRVLVGPHRKFMPAWELVQQNGGAFPYPADVLLDEGSLRTGAGEVICLPLVGFEDECRDALEKNPTFTVAVLLLEETRDREYRRIGIAYMWDVPQAGSWFDDEASRSTITLT